MGIEVLSKGDGRRTLDFLKHLLRGEAFSDLDRYGQMGVTALSSATPVHTGLTAASWNYRIVKSSHETSIEWHNDNLSGDGVPVVILLQYGHGTRNGGYVHGRDFINPAIQPIFDQIEAEVWKKVMA